MQLILCSLILIFTLSSFAQEEVGQISDAISIPGREQSVFQVKAIFDSFKNQAFQSSGIHYGAEVGYESVGVYSLYLGLPFMYGQIQSKNVSELGNPYVGGSLLFFEETGFQTWASIKNKFSRPDAEIAARHNTLIPGFEVRYDKSKTVGSIGADYYWRSGEADSNVDVKDIVAAHVSVGRRLSSKFTLGGELLWYRAFGVKNQQFTLARESDWMGAGPVGKLQLGSGVVMKSSVLFPIQESRSQEETEIAVWDPSLPKVSGVTWRTDLGVQF